MGVTSYKCNKQLKIESLRIAIRHHLHHHKIFHIVIFIESCYYLGRSQQSFDNDSLRSYCDD